MKVIICGGDGFCGWPTSLFLSSCGHEVLIIDNLVRRAIDIDLEVMSLTPIQFISERIKAWHEVSGKDISFINMDIVASYDNLLRVICAYKPDAIIHFAEQRSAPFSMKSPKKKRYTVDNNVIATNNILVAIVESGIDIHLIHLGTIGVYGYSSQGIVIPEGYLSISAYDINKHIVEKEILYPTDPGSIYHLTKTLDQLLFAYYNKNDKVRITDLHQGIVWGTQTDETALDERLINRFDYDGDYGTVLNRFLMQGALNYPLTVHGTGGQKRGFIHIKDTVRCLQLSLENPPNKGDRVCIRNQITETHRVKDLAKLVSDLTGVPISYVSNPRNEDTENDFEVSNQCFLDLGLKPTKLAEGLLTEVYEVAKKYAHRCDISKIPCLSYWDSDRAAAGNSFYQGQH